MNQTSDHKLSEILNTDYIPVIHEDKPISVQQEDSQAADIEADANFARGQIYNIIAQGEEAINLIGNIAKETTHPRALEVMSQLLKTQSDNIDKLLKLQKDKKDLQKDNLKQQTNINVEQAIFVGSTADLLKKVRDESSNQN